jgi:tetratricopeptide (TPR) repeat protein
MVGRNYSLKKRQFMKLLRLIFIYLIFSINHFSYSSETYRNLLDKPLLAVVIMVKNEELAMEETLKPFFDAGLRHYLILDTGSTDQTVSTTLKLFEKYNIANGYVRENPFVDFSTSRNHALEFAEELFPNAVFFLMIDAEWHMHKVDSLLEFCATHEKAPESIYLCKLTNNMFTNYLNRLFKAHDGIRFIGKVHECPNRVATIQIPDFYIFYNPSEKGQEKSRQRWYTDCKILLKEHEKDPNNPRTLFFLGQTYQDLQDNENACVWYEKRCKIIDTSDEYYISHYKLAYSYDLLGNWTKAIEYYLKAFSLRPNRIEPLIQIAYHYTKTGDFSIAYLFAKHATTIKQPEQEIVFVETIFYDLVRYELLAFAAWNIGEYEIGQKATEQALKHFESNNKNSDVFTEKKEQLLKNLSIFKQKLLGL